MAQNQLSGLLAFDIGNTNIHMGLWYDGAWRLSWRARTIADKMPDEYAVLVRNFLSSANLTYADVSGVVIGCVVPPLTPSFTELSQRYLNIEPVIVSSSVNTGVKVAIDQPQQAGADRIANAAAVYSLGYNPAIVVDFGTSTNFDLISADNAYLGGALAPGLAVSHDALVNRADRLHKIDLVPPPNPIGSNTIHAMQSGIFWGYVSLIEGLTSRLKLAMIEAGYHGGKDIQVIATGGLATLVNPHTHVFDRLIETLTLDGLRVIYDLNR
jgi:type III pantothenate kinase